MENIVIEGTSKTPQVEFKAETGEILIKGRSIPENSIEFYKPLIDWIDNYANGARDVTEVNIQLEYFNTSSSKCILDVFKRLELIRNSGKSVTVKWHYEVDDEDMLEAGEDYQAIIDLPFQMIEIEEV
jgi:O6-methylguanine-DNA--protein-cysteine methyltransferase